LITRVFASNSQFKIRPPNPEQFPSNVSIEQVTLSSQAPLELSMNAVIQRLKAAFSNFTEERKRSNNKRFEVCDVLERDCNILHQMGCLLQNCTQNLAVIRVAFRPAFARAGTGEQIS
jgi:hypothetical protein